MQSSFAYVSYYHQPQSTIILQLPVAHTLYKLTFTYTQTLPCCYDLAMPFLITSLQVFNKHVSNATDSNEKAFALLASHTSLPYHTPKYSWAPLIWMSYLRALRFTGHSKCNKRAK